jgi:hypothetical protein
MTEFTGAATGAGQAENDYYDGKLAAAYPPRSAS